MKINKIVKVLSCVVLLAIPVVAVADDLGDGNGNGDVQDVPAAPISDYAPVLVLGALVLGYQLTKKKLKPE